MRDYSTYNYICNILLQLHARLHPIKFIGDNCNIIQNLEFTCPSLFNDNGK